MGLHILRNSVCFIDGFRVSETTELKLPAFKLKTEKLWFGGSDGEIECDFGILAMEASIKLGAVSPEVMAKVGLAPGKRCTFNFNGAAVSEEDGSTIGVSCRITGKIRDDEAGAWKHGDKTDWDYKIMCRTYKLTVGDKVPFDINPSALIRIINGVDELAAVRAAMLM